MHWKHAICAVALSSALSAGALFAQPQTPQTQPQTPQSQRQTPEMRRQTPQNPPDADNTRQNERDRTKNTADQAKNNTNDREMMQKIRQSVVSDNSLSTYAHNVKIVAKNGKITLRGPVRSEEEKKMIARKAEDVAGAGNVVDDITIKPEKSKQ